MPQRVGKQETIAGLAEQLHRPRGVRMRPAFFAFGVGAHVTAREHRERAAVRLGYVGQQIHRLDRQRPAGLGHPNPPLTLAAVGMGVTGKTVAGGADDRLRHRELDVRPHDFGHQVEDARAVDQIDKGLVVGQQITPIHERLRIGIGMLDPGIMAELEIA